MGICAQCCHFRRTRPPSQVLAAVFTTTHADVSQALNKIVEDEQKIRDAEADYKRAQASTGKLTWLTQPVMSEYCAWSEASSAHVIPELKNAGGACTDFDPRPRPRRACADCRHRITPDGRARDQAREEVYTRMSIAATANKGSTSQPESMLGTHRQGVAARMSFELSGAYMAKGELSRRPDYLDYCARYSSGDTFVACALRNLHHACAGWEPAQESAAVAPPEPPPIPVSEGAPMATMPIAELTDAFEWILGIRIPASMRPHIDSALADEMGRGAPDLTAGATELLTGYRLAQAHNQETRDAAREEHQAEFVAWMRGQPGDAMRVLLVLYDADNAPIALGNPPLTREMAGCYLDLMGFLQSLAHNVDWQPLPEPYRTQCAQTLAAQYPYLHPGQQAWLASLPKGWTALRAAWRNTPPEQRAIVRDRMLAEANASGLASGMMPQLPVAGAATPPPYPPPQQYGQPPQSAQPPQYAQPSQYVQPQPYAAASLPAAGAMPTGKSVDDLVAEINRADDEEERRLMKEDPQLALQAKLQRSARNAQMLTNIMQMRHESMMSIARNIR